MLSFIYLIYRAGGGLSILRRACYKYIMSNISFSEQIYATVRKIPRGKVATYGQIAELSGHPNAARAVGNALHKNPYEGDVPCHRVVNSRGGLAHHFAFDGPFEQKYRLEQEGVVVTGSAPDFFVDLATYGITLNYS